MSMLLVRGLVAPEQLMASNDTVGSYLQTVGTIYTVLLAFVVFVVWSQFNDARSAVERSMQAKLVDLHRTTRALPPGMRAPIHAALAAYVEAVLGREWTAMATNDEATIDDVGRLLDPLWRRRSRPATRSRRRTARCTRRRSIASTTCPTRAAIA
ncbi:MAG: hypothetical protein U1F43_35690 [Myxococcota bacterium]